MSDEPTIITVPLGVVRGRERSIELLDDSWLQLTDDGGCSDLDTDDTDLLIEIIIALVKSREEG
jgi:hypothetical protein